MVASLAIDPLRIGQLPVPDETTDPEVIDFDQPGYGAKLKAARKALRPKVSQARLGEIVGVGERVIAGWEREEYKPRWEHRITLARTLAVQIAGLPPEFTGTGATIEPLREKTPTTPEKEMAGKHVEMMDYYLRVEDYDAMRDQIRMLERLVERLRAQQST